MTTPEKLLGICGRALDPEAKPVTYHAGHDQTCVLRAATRYGEVIVKIHRHRERQERERDAYRRWVPALGERAPRLLTEIDDPPGIIITVLPGKPMAELALPPEIERDAFGRAGMLLAAWHRAEPPRDRPDMTTWLAARGERWLHLAKQVLPARKRADIRSHLRALAELGPLPAVPCHLDFTTRNLLHAPDGAVGVIDFEHARYDLAARDLVRLSARVWPDRPDLEDAFLAHYGPLSELDLLVIEHCTFLDALTAAVRATGRTLQDQQTDAG